MVWFFFFFSSFSTTKFTEHWTRKRHHPTSTYTTIFYQQIRITLFFTSENKSTCSLFLCVEYLNSSSELGNIFVRELVTDCKKSICHCKGTHTQSMKLDANTSVTTCVWENNKQTQCFFFGTFFFNFHKFNRYYIFWTINFSIWWFRTIQFCT